MKLFKLLILAFAVALCFLSMPKAGAYDLFSPCKNHPDAPACQAKGDKNPAVNLINSAANLIAVGTGVIGIIMIIFGGLTLITSNGNTQNVEAARRRIIFALVGMAIVALAWTITRFITDKLIQ